MQRRVVLRRGRRWPGCRVRRASFAARRAPPPDPGRQRWTRRRRDLPCGATSRSPARQHPPTRPSRPVTCPTRQGPRAGQIADPGHRGGDVGSRPLDSVGADTVGFVLSSHQLGSLSGFAGRSHRGSRCCPGLIDVRRRLHPQACEPCSGGFAGLCGLSPPLRADRLAARDNVVQGSKHRLQFVGTSEQRSRGDADRAGSARSGSRSKSVEDVAQRRHGGSRAVRQGRANVHQPATTRVHNLAALWRSTSTGQCA